MPKISSNVKSLGQRLYLTENQEENVGNAAGKTMDIEFPSTRMFGACIEKVERILRLVVGQGIPERVESELQELKNDLIENRRRAQEEEKRILEEIQDDHIKRVVQRELEIFQQDDVITGLREDVTELQTQLAVTQNDLVQTRNNLTTRLEQTENELAALREIVNQLRDN